MARLRLSTINQSAKHRRMGKKAKIARRRVFTIIAVLFVLVAGVYGLVSIKRMHAPGPNVEIYMGEHLMGRVTQRDLQRAGDHENPQASLKEVLRLYSALPLINENVILIDEGGQKHPLSRDALESPANTLQYEGGGFSYCHADEEIRIVRIAIQESN